MVGVCWHKTSKLFRDWQWWRLDIKRCFWLLYRGKLNISNLCCIINTDQEHRLSISMSKLANTSMKCCPAKRWRPFKLYILEGRERDKTDSETGGGHQGYRILFLCKGTYISRGWHLISTCFWFPNVFSYFWPPLELCLPSQEIQTVETDISYSLAPIQGRSDAL